MGLAEQIERRQSRYDRRPERHGRSVAAPSRPHETIRRSPIGEPQEQTFTEAEASTRPFTVTHRPSAPAGEARPCPPDRRSTTTDPCCTRTSPSRNRKNRSKREDQDGQSMQQLHLPECGSIRSPGSSRYGPEDWTRRAARSARSAAVRDVGADQRRLRKPNPGPAYPRSTMRIHRSVSAASRPISTPRTISGTIRTAPTRSVTIAAAAVLFPSRNRSCSNIGQIAIATTTAHANAGRKSQITQIPMAESAKIRPNWPSRCGKGCAAANGPGARRRSGLLGIDSHENALRRVRSKSEPGGRDLTDLPREMHHELDVTTRRTKGLEEPNPAIFSALQRPGAAR